MSRNALFIAATGQNVGKTTTCLGIFSGLRKRFSSVGFLKPIGQIHCEVEECLSVDKDAVLFREAFHLSDSYRTLSPIIVPSGYTRSFVEANDPHLPPTALYQQITDAFEALTRKHPFTLVEGTGHVGVGSILGANNAQVAKALGLDMVIVASGGLGSTIDTLALNLALCKQEGVRVRGVILNRVLEEKRSMILESFPKALARWDLPLLAVIPYCPFLTLPTLADFERLFETKLLAGQEYLHCHFPHNRLIAGSLASSLREKVPSELLITPASREDILYPLLNQYKPGQAGLLLTGKEPPSEALIAQIQKTNFPTLYVPLCSYDAMKTITSFTAKIDRHDQQKIDKAIELVEPYIDFEALCSDPSPKKSHVSLHR